MYWDYILSTIGVAGFILAGKKIWWAWYVNIGAQFVWVTYALVTEQYGFIIGAAIYFAVFIKNAYDWTKEHREQMALANVKFESKVDDIDKALGEAQRLITTKKASSQLHARFIKGGRSDA